MSRDALQYLTPSEESEAVNPNGEHPHNSELTRYLPQLKRMSTQLLETSRQIEAAVVDVCGSFHGIAQRAEETVTRAAGFLSSDQREQMRGRSFESVVGDCSGILLKILNAFDEAGEVSHRAMQRMQRIDSLSVEITAALEQLNRIAKGNKMLAFNARIQAAHAGELGVGFSVVASEVVTQTEKSETVTATISGLIATLREMAASTLADLGALQEQDRRRVGQCKREVDELLPQLQSAHHDMAQMLEAMTRDGSHLASDIGAAVRGLQFQDRTGQRLAHVIEDLDRICAHIEGSSDSSGIEDAPDETFSAYTMQEERVVAGIHSEEAPQGDIELF